MRNKALDQSRLTAAFLVILIHAPLPGIAGQVGECISRVAVPLFFMISGYYACGKSGEALRRSTGRTAVMLLWSVSLYFLWEMFWAVWRGTVLAKLWAFFSVRTLVETFILNTGVLLGHLWFLLALMYCYLLYRFIFRNVSYGGKMTIAVSLIVLSFVIREVLRYNGVSDTVYYTRNFLFVGIPFFLIGDIVQQSQDQLTNTRGSVWVFLALVGTLAAVAERVLVGSCDLYVGTVAAAIAWFVLAQRQLLPANSHLSELGRRYAGDIYIFHVILIGVFNMAASVMGCLNSGVYLVFRPFAVIAVCIAIAYGKERIVMAVSKKDGEESLCITCTSAGRFLKLPTTVWGSPWLAISFP